MENLVQIDGKFYTQEIADQIRYADSQVDHYDLLQLTKKISLNSAYGALLAPRFRYGLEEKIGASVTYTGRAITSFMMDVTAELLTGENAGVQKSYKLDVKKGKVSNIYTTDNSVIIMSDTDSAYFLTGAPEIEEAVLIADEVGNALTGSFIPFMKQAFLCQPNYDNLIVAGREIVADRLLAQARKKYIAHVVDLEGFRVNKIKAMGSEVKKSDTPKVIQKFLKNVLDRILDGMDYKNLSSYVNEQRNALFKEQISPSEIIMIGTSKSANNLEHFTDAFHAEIAGTPFKSKSGKGRLTVPGHCRAAIQYNLLLEEFSDKVSMPINNGDKVKIFQLKKNEFGFMTIAFPGEITRFPTWFLENFEIDLAISEEKLITNKLEGIFGCQGLEVPSPQLTKVLSVVEF